MTMNRTRHSRPRPPVEPVRPAVDCDTCRLGCDCDGSPEHPGCEHWACWGRTATNDCPSAQPLREHLHAYMEYRQQLSSYASSASFFGA